MNKNDRRQLAKAITFIESAKEIIDSIKDGEQEKFDNLSDNLQQSERGQKFEEDIVILEDVCDNLDNAINDLSELL